MSLEMVRIDDRLIHGQVVVGWCPDIEPDRLILCDDEIASCDWESEIYQDAAPEYETSVCTVEGTARLLGDDKTKKECIFLIVSSPAVLVRLMKRGIKIERVTVGGMHYQEGKRKIANYVFIDDTDLEHFRYLVRNNVTLEARDVPTCRPVDLTQKLKLR